MRVSAALLLLLSLPFPGSAQDRFEEAIHIGAVDSLRSATLDEVRPYLVYTPPSYDDTLSTPQHYPVLYLLDGDAHFHSVSGLVQILGTGVNGTFAIPEMIVVAIPNTDRTRDLTPTHTTLAFDGEHEPALETSGGNAAFFTFLEDELIPHIEARYRTMPYRIFVGHSFGGITTLNALYSIPETFDAYVAIDPSLWWDDEVLLRRAKDYFRTEGLDGKVLYVAQANTVQPDDTTADPHFSAITRFDAVMRAYDRSGIRYAFRYYDDDSHGSVPLIAEYDALRFIFDGYRVPLQRVMAEPDLLVEHFEEVSERLGATFRPSEGMVSQLARFALTQDTARAIELGELRVELYPESSRAYEFLGDVWAGRGDVERARAFYEQALERSPDRASLREKLEGTGRGGAARDRGREPPRSIEEAARTPSGLVEALYDMVSFEPGPEPDWTVFRKFFLEDAILVFSPTATQPMRPMGIDGFVQDWRDFFREAGLEDRGFQETIAAMEVTEFGGLAHAFVVFEPRVGSAEPARRIRGLDSIELSWDGERWWIAAITTDFEGPGRTIPDWIG